MSCTPASTTTAYVGGVYGPVSPVEELKHLRNATRKCSTVRRGRWAPAVEQTGHPKSTDLSKSV